MRNIVTELQNLKLPLSNLFGITSIALFGSYARGDASESSDIDILIISMKRKNGFLIASARRFIEEKTNLPVDIGLFDAVRPYIRKDIEKEMIYV